MEQINDADDGYLYFSLNSGGERYYRFDSNSETFQVCKSDCVENGNPVSENFGVLAKNVNVDQSSFVITR